MELILNRQKIKSVRGSLCYGWYVQCRNGRFFCYYRGREWWQREFALKQLFDCLELLKTNGWITDYKPTKNDPL